LETEPPGLLIIAFTVAGISVIKPIALFCLLACSALISGAEVAFFSLSSTDINEAEASKTSSGNILVKLLNKPKKLLATILIANNFVNIAVVLIFSSLSDTLFSGITTVLWGVLNLRFMLEVVVVTFMILLLGEILPKIYARRNHKKFAYFMAHPIYVLDRLLSPLSLPMRSATLYLQEKLGAKKTNLSVNKLSQALDLTSETETTKEEQKILRGIVSFGNTDTKQVMRPRIDIFAVNEETSFTRLLTEIIKNGYSRIPVYRDNLDTITGVLYVKDLLPYLNQPSFNWVSLVRDPYFIPQTKKLDDLLREFQEMKNHLAIVVDEYGGTAGLITLEDIIEEIVGDISDEFDDEDIVFSKLDDNSYIFDGKTALKDFYRMAKIQDDALFETHKGDAETLAGFVLEIAGNFPQKGEKINFHTYTFTIEAIDNKRIKQLKVTL
jgi:putative hemolysin